MRICPVLAATSQAAGWYLFVLRTCWVVIAYQPAYVRNMSLAEIEEAVKGLNRLNRKELAKLANYIPALRATRADPMLALAHNT